MQEECFAVTLGHSNSAMDNYCIGSHVSHLNNHESSETAAVL
jgi:hypothetical protein